MPSRGRSSCCSGTGRLCRPAVPSSRRERGGGLSLCGSRPPLPAESPYCEQGAVFAHAVRCAGPDSDGYPTDWSTRPQVLRAYTSDGRIHPASRLHDGTDPARALAQVLAEDGVVEVHSRNIVYGCFMFSARLAEA